MCFGSRSGTMSLTTPRQRLTKGRMMTWLSTTICDIFDSAGTVDLCRHDLASPVHGAIHPALRGWERMARTLLCDAAGAQLYGRNSNYAEEIGPPAPGVEPYARCSLWLLNTAPAVGSGKVRVVTL